MSHSNNALIKYHLDFSGLTIHQWPPQQVFTSCSCCVLTAMEQLWYLCSGLGLNLLHGSSFPGSQVGTLLWSNANMEEDQIKRAGGNIVFSKASTWELSTYFPFVKASYMAKPNLRAKEQFVCFLRNKKLSVIK